MKAYSDDLRGRVPTDCDGGMGTRAVARKYRVSEAWVRRVKPVRRASGRADAGGYAGGRTPGWVTHADAIRRAVREAPDATPDEYRARFALPLSRAAPARAPAALGLTREKSRFGRASRTGRT